jgi:hypothetical protein
LVTTFPGVGRDDGGGWRVKEEGKMLLARVRGECTGLVRIELLVYGPGARELVEADLDVGGSAREVFSKADEHLRGVRSLERIALRVSRGSASPSVKDFVQELGWVVY